MEQDQEHRNPEMSEADFADVMSEMFFIGRLTSGWIEPRASTCGGSSSTRGSVGHIDSSSSFASFQCCTDSLLRRRDPNLNQAAAAAPSHAGPGVTSRASSLVPGDFARLAAVQRPQPGPCRLGH